MGGMLLMRRAWSGGTGCLDDSSDLVRGTVDVVVRHGGGEPGGLRDLLRREVEPPPDRRLRLGPSATEPSLELLERGRREEDQERPRHTVADLLRALDVDLEDHVHPAPQRLIDVP